MPITLNGSTSGQVTIEAPAVAGTTTLTLPSANGNILTDQSSLASAKLTGALPAIDGSALTGISSYTNANALSLFNASGSAPVYACRAWVNFTGTGTVGINASGNVSSVTDNGIGDYTISFTTAMQDANYALYGSVYLASGNNTRSLGGSSNYSLSAGSARVQSMGTGGALDCEIIAAGVLR